MTDRRSKQVVETRLLRTIESWETEIPVLSTAPFDEEWIRLDINGEKIRCKSKAFEKFTECERGLSQTKGGPPPLRHQGMSVVKSEIVDELATQKSGELISIRPTQNISPLGSILAEILDDPDNDLTNIELSLTEEAEVELALPTGCVLIGEPVHFLNVNEVLADGYFSDAFDDYYIRVKLSARSSTLSEFHRIQMRLNEVTASGAADYAWQRTSAQAAATGVSSDGADPSMACAITGVSTTQMTVHIWLHNPFLAEFTLMRSFGQCIGTNHLLFDHSGWHALANSYNGFRYFPDSGTISGVMLIYGWRQ